MKKILFISSRPIYPIVGGDQIRTAQQLNFLTDRYCVDILYLSATNNTENIQKNQPKIRSEYRFHLPKIVSCLHTFRFLFNYLPLQVNYYYSKKAEKYIKNNLYKYDAVFCNNIRTAEYVRKTKGIIKIIDFVDAISMNYEKARKHANLLMKVVYNIDYHRCKVYESLLLQEFDSAAVISDIDKNYILRNSKVGKDIQVVGNMADVSEYVQETDAHNLVFIGKMSYAPNRLAVSHFVKNVLPLIRNKIPDVAFYIVGASPGKDVLKLHNGKNVIVTGFVENINEYFNLASIIVAPMLSGAGIQNKIIQAMGSGKCVVTTPIGAEGLIIKDEIAIEKNDNDMAEKIIFLLNHKDVRCAMGQEARKYVQQNLSFDAISQQFYKLVAHLL